MIFVGIDVAKDTHYAAVSDDSGAVLVKPFAFQNNAEGFCLLLKKLSEYHADYQIAHGQFLSTVFSA